MIKSIVSSSQIFKLVRLLLKKAKTGKPWMKVIVNIMRTWLRKKSRTTCSRNKLKSKKKRKLSKVLRRKKKSSYHQARKVKLSHLLQSKEKNLKNEFKLHLFSRVKSHWRVLHKALSPRIPPQSKVEANEL